MVDNGKTSRPDDRLVLHPDAAANFNEKALILSGHFGPVQIPGPSGQRSFLPDRHVSRTFSVQDVTDLQIVVHDPEGREVCLALWRPNGPVGLKGDGCALFRSLARQVWQAARLQQAISLRFAEGAILSWLGARHEQASPTTMIDDLLQRAAEAVEPRELWVPIATLYVQSELKIGPITIRTINREMLASWGERVLDTVHGEEERAKTLANLDRQKQELQDLAAATMTVCAEPIRAAEIALERTENVLIVLRALSAVNLRPERVSYCTVFGKEHMEGWSYLRLLDGAVVSVGEGVVKDPVPWQLTDKEVAVLRSAGLDIAAALVFKVNRTEFEDTVVNALRLYARSSLEAEMSDRVIYILAALESLLLKDGGESIQQNLAERLAFYVADTAECRMKIAATLRAIYAGRSGFLHHGRELRDKQHLVDFLRYAWFCHLKVLRSAGQFATQREFVESIELIKFS
jgi:hypothetical protein